MERSTAPCATAGKRAVRPGGPDRQAIVKDLNDMMVQNYVVIPLVHRGYVSAKAQQLGEHLKQWLGHRDEEQSGLGPP